MNFFRGLRPLKRFQSFPVLSLTILDNLYYSRNRFNNNNNFNGRRNQVAIVEACDSESDKLFDSQNDEEEVVDEIRLMSIMPQPYPLNGSEITEDSNFMFQDRETLIQALHGFGFPKTKDRVFVEFVYPITNEKGRALIDCGANTDAMSLSFIRKASISNIDKKESIVKDFQGKPCKSPGKVDTCLQLGRCFYKGNFMIFDGNFKTDVILGMPFLNRYGLGDVICEKVSDITGPNTVLSGEPKNF